METHSAPSPSPNPARNGGWFDRTLGAVKGLTFQNVAVMASLLMLAAPTYLAWRVLNDESLLNMVFSEYEELGVRMGDCAVRRATPKGGETQWFLSYTFAHQSANRWAVSVSASGSAKPATAEETQKLCDTLISIVDYMENPTTTPKPTYPNSDRPIF
jgi:hypothetical protein